MLPAVQVRVQRGAREQAKTLGQPPQGPVLAAPVTDDGQNVGPGTPGF